MALRAPMRSRRIFHRSAKGVPWCSISSAFHPPPMPKSTRPLREVIEARYLLGDQDRVALDDEADTGPELERLGHHSRRAQGYEGIEGVPVLARQVGSAGPRALAAGRDVRVLGEPHGLERARFQLACELVDRYGVVGREHGDAVFHGIGPFRLKVSDERR